MNRLVRVLRSGDLQSVTLPVDVLPGVDLVEVSQDGDAVILKPHQKPAIAAWSSLRAAAERGVSDDFLQSIEERNS